MVIIHHRHQPKCSAFHLLQTQLPTEVNRKPMEVDPDHGGNNGNDGFKIAELERRLTEETDRCQVLQSQSELSKLVSGQEVGKWRRETLSLRETASRLKEDCNRLRERELKDQETIKNLLEEVEAKEREFSEKFVELKVENRDLECAKRRAQEEAREWKKKYEEAEAAAAGAGNAKVLKLVGGNFHLVEKEKGAENGNAEEQSIKRKRKTETDQELTKKIAEVVVDSDSGRDDEDDGTPLAQLSKKRHAEVAAEKDSGSLRESSAQRCKLGKLGATGAKRSKSAKVGGARTPSAPGNNTQKVADRRFRAYKKRNSRNQMSRRKYTGLLASFQEVMCAEKKAKTLQRNLNPFNPSFIKTMAPSHVSGCFWLGLPQKFCKENLPSQSLKMKLEDEKGSEYKVNYIGKKKCLSAGWKGFALAHKLEIGDALIFELSEPATFKVYILKAITEKSSKDFDDEISDGYTDGTTEQEKH